MPIVYRILAAIAALGFLAVPLIWPTGWEPLLADWLAAALLAFAVFGYD